MCTYTPCTAGGPQQAAWYTEASQSGKRESGTVPGLLLPCLVGPVPSPLSLTLISVQVGQEEPGPGQARCVHTVFVGSQAV